MKVGLLTPNVSRTGAGIWAIVASLGRALAKANLDVEIFSLAGARTPADYNGRDGPPLVLHRIVGTGAFAYAPRLRAALDARGLSLLHTNGLWMYPSLASLRWSRHGARPYVVSPHGFLDPWAVRRSRWKKLIAGALFEHAHLCHAACLHALNEAEARAIRAYGLRNPICIIPAGMELPTDEPRFPPAWRENLDEDRKVLFYLGRLHPKKGLANLIRAWKHLQRDGLGGDWLLVIAGWDQDGHEQELKNLVRELGLHGSVRFVGPQFHESKAASLAFAHAFVLPSFSEGMPIAVLEAWSYGLPVVMTPQCNLPEGFAAGAALPVEPRTDAVRDGLIQLFTMSDAERQSMGAAARRLVRERFAWPQIAAEMTGVYEWILGGGSPPSYIMTD